MPPGNGAPAGPDKRTTAYEQIFGRPTAKPKGPVAQPNAQMHYQQQQQQQQLWQQQQLQQQQAAAYYLQQQQQQGRWTPAPGQPQRPAYQHAATTMGGTFTPSPNSHPQDSLDRRASYSPSLNSQSTAATGYGSQPYTGSSAADSYYAPQGSTPATSSAAHFYYQAQDAGSSAGPSIQRVSSPHQPMYPRQPGSPGFAPDGYADPRASMSSNTSSAYARPVSQRTPSLAESASSFGQKSNSPDAPPFPRLPSIELQSGVESPGSEGNWFKGLSMDDTIIANGKTGSSRDNSPQKVESLQVNTKNGLQDEREHDDFATPGPREGGDPFASEFQAYDTEVDGRSRQDSRADGGVQSSASSTYDESLRRKASIDSDQRSIANSINTLPGVLSNGSQTAFFPGMIPSHGSNSNLRYYSPAYGAPGASATSVTTADMWQRQPRMRTASTNTQAGQIGYSPSIPEGKMGRFDQRSMSMGNGQSSINRTIGPPTTAISHASSTGSGAHAQSQPTHRKGPLVYPALLSRVAEAFKQRIMIAEKVKDGLTYQDAFDGRQAVDQIAYIIKTTDRNLALLLGRALDSQKFFHDVTYDHRLRDSTSELYQFRTRLTTPFGTEGPMTGEDHFVDAPDGSQLQPPGAATRTNSAASSIRERDTMTGMTSLQPPDGEHVKETSEDEEALPTGVFTLLTDCYSPTCTRDRLCYSIACPRRLEQQARLNMKPQPVLKRSISRESLNDVKAPGALWAESVSKEIFDSVPEQERKRQELINEVMYTERDFVRDLEYLRDQWIKPLRTRDIIPEARREDFVTQVFWNVLEVHAVNSKLAELLTKRQKHQAVVDRIGDIFLEMVPHFQPFVKYGAHQLYGKYEFEKEKASNVAFATFVNETERLPESRKLELNGYLTKPTTRLARYPLLLEAVLKQTADNNPDKQTIPKVVKIVKEFLNKVNIETGKSENRFNLAQLDQQLVFKQGEAVDLRLRDEQRELVFKAPLKKRGGTQSESAELQVFLFDHALLMVKAKTVQKNELYKVFRKPIPLELLLVTVYDEVPTGKGTATRPKSVMSKTSVGHRLSGGVPTGSAPKQDAKTGYALTFTYLGRKGYTLTLWASTFVGRKKWFEHIEERQEILRQRSNIFDTIALSENFFAGLNKVTCSVPFDFGRRIIYGTEDGVYLSDLREKARPPTKVLPLPGVTQVDVLEEYQILIILAERSVHTFTLDALDPSDPMGSLKRGRRISSHTSFFRAGQCLGRTLVCVVKSSSLSSTIKTLEPIEQNIRGKKQPTFRKLLQGGQESLRVFKEFYIPTESSSIHFLKSKLCVGCTKGFEIVDLETLDTQGLLDPADSSLDFVHRKETVKPIAIYRIDGEFLLCYDEFAFYVNKNGWRAKGNWIIHWEGNPTAFALHHPYVLAFEPSFIEVRHVETGALHQVITGYNMRCLFADVPPPAPRVVADASLTSIQQPIFPYGGGAGMPPLAGGPQGPHGMAMRGPGGSIGPHPGYPGPGRPGVSPNPANGAVFGPNGAMMYPMRPPGPYGGAPPVVRAPPQRNPVWESVAASRNQIVFIGDTTVFAVRLAGASNGGMGGGGSSIGGSPALG